MTVEQKAEEIANKRCHEIMCLGHCNFSSPKHHRCGEWHREYNCALDGYHECQKEHEWHYDGTPDTTHKTCIVYVDYLPNIMLCFWNGEVWIEPRTLERFKKVKAWKYVDFPQEIE